MSCAGCSEPERCGHRRGDVCLGMPDVDYGPVWVEPIDTPTKPPYGSPERAAFDLPADPTKENQ